MPELNELHQFEDIQQLTKYYPVYYIILGIGAMVFSFIQIFAWNYVQERQMRRIRVEFFKSLLSQEIGWHDEQKMGDFVNKYNQ